MFLQLWYVADRRTSKGIYVAGEYEGYINPERSNLETSGEGYVIPYGDGPHTNHRLAENVYLDILNRADNARYPNDPVSVVAAPNQFSCYKEGKTIVPTDFVANVMRDALNGVRNNKYYSFNAWYTHRSENYIVEGGNRYF